MDYFNYPTHNQQHPGNYYPSVQTKQYPQEDHESSSHSHHYFPGYTASVPSTDTSYQPPQVSQSGYPPTSNTEVSSQPAMLVTVKSETITRPTQMGRSGPKHGSHPFPSSVHKLHDGTILHQMQPPARSSGTVPNTSNSSQSTAQDAMDSGVEDTDHLRIKTKGEQKAFDPNKINRDLIDQSTPLSTQCGKSGDKENQNGTISAHSNEPGKTALAGKLHQKYGSEKIVSCISIKLEREDDKENQQTKNTNTITDVPDDKSSSWEWNADKLITDLSFNRDVTTSKKTKTLGRRYDQKLSIQKAIDNDEVAPPTVPVSEPESESEAEAPVKFRGKFKSIKDKLSNERIILTYASHSDESCTELIPDEDASDYELELQREISYKKKKKHSMHNHKPRRNCSSSSNEPNSKVSRNHSKTSKSSRSLSRKIKTSKKPLDKSRHGDDTDFSLHSSECGSNSSESSDSDEEDSDDTGNSSDESNRQHKRHKVTSDSSDDDSDVGRRTRRRPVLKARTRHLTDSSEDEETASTSRSQRIAKSRKVSDEDDDAYEPPRSVRIKTRSTKNSKRRKVSSSPEVSNDDQFLVSTKNDKTIKSRFFKIDKSKNRNLSSSNYKKIQKNETTNTSSDTESKNDEKHIRKFSNKRMHIESESEHSTEENIGKIKTTVSSESENEDPKSNRVSKESTNTTKRSSSVSESSEEDDQSQSIEVIDSILLKLQTQRTLELQREDVLQEKARRLEISRKMQEKLDALHEEKFRQSWAKPKFGSSDRFCNGWQEGFLKFKREFARLPKKLLYSKSFGSISLDDFAQQNSNNQNLQFSKTSPAKNTRSKSSTNMSPLSSSEKPRDGFQSSNCMVQNFFERVVSGEDSHGGNDSDTKLGVRKFAMDSFPPFGTLRVHTGLTPTPSVAPSMMASDESDSDSLASRRSPASDSAPLARRKSVASQLIKKFRRKYNRVNVGWLNRPRIVLTSDPSPKLLPTPGLDSHNSQIDLRKLSTFFRKDTVEANAKAFEQLFQNNGINIFSTPTLESRTRKETKQMLDESTIKSVFGDIPHKMENPLIAKKIVAKKLIPITNSTVVTRDSSVVVGDDSTSLPPSTRTSTPTDSGALSGVGDDSEMPGDIASELGGRLEELKRKNDEQTFSAFGVDIAPIFRIKKHKRKHKINKSSGFDYLRKKKKPMPKPVDDELTTALKKKTV